MAYEQLDAGSGGGGDYVAGDEWSPEIGTQVRNNFDDHQSRLVAAEAGLVTAADDIDAVELAVDDVEADIVTLTAAVAAVGVSALVLLGTYTASAQATLAVATRNAAGKSGAIFQSDHDVYEIVIQRCLPVVDGAILNLRCSTNGGSSYDSGSNYRWMYEYNNSANSRNGGASASATSAYVCGSIDNTVADGGGQNTFRIYDPLSGTMHKHWGGRSQFRGNDTNYYMIDMGGCYVVTTAVDALQFLMDSGNISSMTVRVYGIGK